MKLKELSIFFLDLQTTGSHPNSGEVLEIAWGMSTKHSENLDEVKNYFVTQENGYIPYHIQKLTGITQEDLKGSRDRADIISELGSMTNVPCVIHYAQFEIPFLKSWFNDEIPFPILCTHDIARRLFPNLPTRSLKGLAGFFGHQKEDIKRSIAHLDATEIIWRGLILELEKNGILTFEDLKAWLGIDFKKKKSKYEYPLEKDKRLNLSKAPGIYRMLNRSGEVLYVGKATSLHSRVNSYFRGQKNRDTKKLEMLTQVWDIQTTECKSPLEAALLETDEIKRLDPPYNISLKTNDRKLVFFNKDFSLYSHTQDKLFPIGPFSNSFVLDSVRNLSYALKNKSFAGRIFFDIFPAEIIEEGFNLFCHEHDIKSEVFQSVRSAIAFGLHLSRKNQTAIDENFEEETADLIIGAEDIAQKFKRHFIRAGRAYVRTSQLTKLLNKEVCYPVSKAQTHTLYFQKGKLIQAQFYQRSDVLKDQAWQDLDIVDYDRMSVLYSELMKLRSG